ncbi:MAG: hypothetical protein U0528_00880 [Anaerolineae bacterium]|nr:hypothetical protein [Anaerolineae bacterium]
MKHQIVLSEREVWSLPQPDKSIRVLEGTAWVSEGGRDFILLAGDQFKGQTHRDKVVISAARNRGQLVIELIEVA